MLAHVSLSHLSDPAVTLTGVGLILVYLLWRMVVRPRWYERPLNPSTEPPSAASSSPR